MAAFERAELWSDVQAGNGTRRAVIPRILGLTEHVAMGGEHTITLDLPYDSPANVTLDTPAGETNVDITRVVRLLHCDGTWTEHRIISSRSTNDAGKLRRRIIARSIWLDLGMKGIITRYLGEGKRTMRFSMPGLTAAEHWNLFIKPALLEGGQDWWELAFELPPTIEALAIDVHYDNDTPLSGLLKVATALGSLEMSMIATDEFYRIVMQSQIGAGASPLVVQARRNLVSDSYEENLTDQATRIFPVGEEYQIRIEATGQFTSGSAGRATMGEAEWHPRGSLPIRTPHPTDPTLELITIQLVDEAGGPGPVQFEDQFSPVAGDYHYALRWVTADFSLAIYKTDLGPSFFSAAPTITLLGLVGQQIPYQGWHRVKIMRSTRPPIAPGYEEIHYLDHPAMLKRYGVLVASLEVPSVPPTNNLVPNSIQQQWPINQLLPTGWLRNLTLPVANITRETGPGDWETANNAIRVVMTEPAHSIYAPKATIMNPSGFLSFFGRMKVIRGSVRIILRFTGVLVNTETGTTTPSGWSVELTPTLPAALKNTTLNLWQDIGIENVIGFGDPGIIQGTAEFEMIFLPTDAVASGQDNEVLIDAAQVTNTPEQRPLLEGNAGVRLFQAANDRLRRYAEPAIQIDANLLDLNTFDPVRFPFDSFVLGGAVQVHDPNLGVNVKTRITGWDRDWLKESNTNIQISSARGDLTKLLALPATRTRAA